MLDGVGDQLRVDDLAVAHRPLRQRYLAESLKRRRSLAEREFGSPDTGGPDVETNRSSSCHWIRPPVPANNPEQLTLLWLPVKGRDR